VCGGGTIERMGSYSEESFWVGKQANPAYSFPTISITILFLPFCFIFHPDIFNTILKVTQHLQSY